MDKAVVFAELDRLIGEAAAGDLPGLLGRLEAAKATAWARMMVPSNGSGHGAATEPDRRLLLTYQEAAELLRCSASYVETLVRQGKLPHVRLKAADKAGKPRPGRLVRLRASDLLAWAEEHRA